MVLFLATMLYRIVVRSLIVRFQLEEICADYLVIVQYTAVNLTQKIVDSLCSVISFCTSLIYALNSLAQQLNSSNVVR